MLLCAQTLKANENKEKTKQSEQHHILFNVFDCTLLIPAEAFKNAFFLFYESTFSVLLYKMNEKEKNSKKQDLHTCQTRAFFSFPLLYSHPFSQIISTFIYKQFYTF